MTLLRKSYSPGIEGGGIPDEKGTCPHCGAPTKVTIHKSVKDPITGDVVECDWEEHTYSLFTESIPDEARIEKAYQLLVKKSKEAYLSSGSFSASPFGLDGIPHVRRDAISKLMVEFSDSELSFASEELARLKGENERLRGGEWISVEDRLPTLADCFSEKYTEVLTIQVGRERPTMMKYYELKHCPFTKFWMRVPQQNKPLY